MPEPYFSGDPQYMTQAEHEACEPGGEKNSIKLVAILEDALLAALPFVEDAENDEAYTKSRVKAVIAKIRSALAVPKY